MNHVSAHISDARAGTHAYAHVWKRRHTSEGESHMSGMVTHGNGGSRRQDLECGLVPEALPSPAGPHTRTPPLSSSTYSPAKSTRTVKTQVRTVTGTAVKSRRASHTFMSSISRGGWMEGVLARKRGQSFRVALHPCYVRSYKDAG